MHSEELKNVHIPVMPAEVLSALKWRSACLKGNTPLSSITVFDGTLGGAGHAEIILKYLTDTAEPKLNIRYIATDLDALAIQRASKRLGAYSNHTEFLHMSYLAGLRHLIEQGGVGLDFVHLDLGFSSNQLEDSRFGLSFMRDGPLDMRMSQSGETAWELLNTLTPVELMKILSAYGEVHRVGFVAHKIIDGIQKGQITNSTLSLAQYLDRLLRNAKTKSHPATTVFQALRIAVNDELATLHTFLKELPDLLNDQAVVSIISFHSLEDRIVKYWGNSLESLTHMAKRPLEPTDEELQCNSRARSAKLRVYRWVANGKY